MGDAVALGFSVHSGWAASVAVAGSPSRPAVLERRRIEIADPAIPGSKQPFHAAERMDFRSAEKLIQICRDRSIRLAVEAVRALAAQLSRNGYRVVGSTILYASGRPLPGLAAILQSHALIHTAEGEFFREAMVRASMQCSLPVIKIRQREVWDRGAAIFRIASADLRLQVGYLGRSLGPPWRQDEKDASITAWIALAEPPIVVGGLEPVER